MSLAACGGGSSEQASNDVTLNDEVMGVGIPVEASDSPGENTAENAGENTVENAGENTEQQSGNLRDLSVAFTAPERLQLIGTALRATVTVAGSDQDMQEVGAGFQTTMSVPMGQDLQVYVSVRRVEDDLLLAAADVTTFLTEDGAAVSLPEQQFRYDFDFDGDGVDNIVEIERGASPTTLSLDFDADGSPDDSDADDDNDGIADVDDAFPFNGLEFQDTDGDGIGNVTDNDDDGDGALDDNDAFPLDVSETSDADFDGIGDNQDTDADGNGIDDDQEDSDGDGVPDQIDLFPNDYYESADADGDGIGDNSDFDDNNDGVADYREGSQIIIPYVDDANIAIDGLWNTYYSNGSYFDEWGKAADNDSFGYSLYMSNLLIDDRINSNTYSYANNQFEMMHDGEYLYIKIINSGEELENWFNDSDDMWNDDSIDLYFDVGYDQLDAYGEDDYQRLFRFRDTAEEPTLDGFYSASGMETDYVTSYSRENAANSVYSQLYEIRVDLDSIGLSPGDTFGFEVSVNDDDDGGLRDTKYGWFAPAGTDEAWRMPSVFGKAKLQPDD